jgi:hypothetical protein
MTEQTGMKGDVAVEPEVSGSCDRPSKRDFDRVALNVVRQRDLTWVVVDEVRCPLREVDRCAPEKQAAGHARGDGIGVTLDRSSGCCASERTDPGWGP